MARPGRGTADQSGPGEEPQGAPRDLYSTSDIRFVMVEVAKLTERVDNLIDRIDEQKNDAKALRDSIGDMRSDTATVKENIRHLPTKPWIGAVIAGAATLLAAIVTAVVRFLPHAT